MQSTKIWKSPILVFLYRLYNSQQTISTKTTLAFYKHVRIPFFFRISYSYSLVQHTANNRTDTEENQTWWAQDHYPIPHSPTTPSPIAQVNLKKSKWIRMKNITNTDGPIVISIHSMKTHKYRRRLQLTYTHYCEQQRNHSKQPWKHNYSLQVQMDAEALQLLKRRPSGIFMCSWLTYTKKHIIWNYGGTIFLKTCQD